MFRNPTTDLIIVLVIVLLIFGPKRLPGLGKHLGTGLREFKESISGDSKDEEPAEHPELTPSTTAPAAAPPVTPSERDAAEVTSPERRS
jgi:sec-independent protein translocase protein TatA